MRILTRVKEQGILVLAIYNDQDYFTKRWVKVKKIYQKLPSWLKPLYVAGFVLCFFYNRLWVKLLACFLRLFTIKNPSVTIINWTIQSFDESRGMHAWLDMVDWIGAWPIEVAKPEEIFSFFRNRGFKLRELKTNQGHRCNEFVLVRKIV